MSFLQRHRLARDRKVTVANLVDELVRRKGNGEVAVYESGVFHLSDLHGEICSIDGFLRRDLALRPGQTVAIFRSNNRECFHWFLAIIRAGGIAVPLNPQLSLTEVRRILADSGTEILVTDKAVFEGTIGQREALEVRTWIQADEEEQTLGGFLRVSGTHTTLPPTDIDPAATVAIFHTSGTSGFPKAQPCRAMRCLGRAHP